MCWSECDSTLPGGKSGDRRRKMKRHSITATIFVDHATTTTTIASTTITTITTFTTCYL